MINNQPDLYNMNPMERSIALSANAISANITANLVKEINNSSVVNPSTMSSFLLAVNQDPLLIKKIDPIKLPIWHPLNPIKPLEPIKPLQLNCSYCFNSPCTCFKSTYFKPKY